jgi:hypothetical protein
VTGDTIEFVRDQAQPVSSAEQTVSDQGYKTLLKNVTSRLDIEVQARGDVDALIARLNTAETVEAAIDQGGSALGVKIVPKRVLEDSRCPTDNVACIQAGTVRVLATLESGLGTAEQTFELDKPVTTEAEVVTLIRVGPERQSTVTITPTDYQFFFRVEKGARPDDHGDEVLN